MVHVVALLMSAVMATAVLAAPMPQAPGDGKGTVCFDDFDCLIAGGKCAKDKTLLGGLLGYCQKKQ
ncbi:hypothetical protein C2857_003777 [Epichloe festucae Fl1]|uniref:Uncharacterized protein n=1 Tax=Epichloe festucae (strain Fl1) TaxID=877507 RepID=A0A7U3SMH1_EPIFF|nr:hypothetical protein C2857_003777 [Epichloe festucae Fl1]